MALAEVWKSPIYGSERIVSNLEASNRILGMYDLVIQDVFHGIAPKKITRWIPLEDAFGGKWSLDISPSRKALYVRHLARPRALPQPGFRTDIKKSDDQIAPSIHYWKKKSLKGEPIPNSEWMFQEAETILHELLSIFKSQHSTTSVK